jgi:hypothetical protein
MYFVVFPFFLQIIVMTITAIIVAINIYGFTQLRQNFDLTMYIPADSYAHQYDRARENYFPNDGIDAAVYCCEFLFIISSSIACYLINSCVKKF